MFLAARMLCWKGVDIAIEVFRRLEKRDNNIKASDGLDRTQFRAL